MTCNVRALVVSKQFSKGLVSKYSAKHRPALIEDPAPVCDKQERRVRLKARAEVPVVKSSDDCLTGAGGSDHKVLVPAVSLPLYSELVEHSLLVRIWVDIEPVEGDRGLTASTLRVLTERLAKSPAIPLRVVGIKMVVFPVSVERGADSTDQISSVSLGKPDVPFQTVKKRGIREVG
jgi:hypothetical protein